MGSYILTLKGLHGDGPPCEAGLTDAVEWARYRYGVVIWDCEDADLLEIECPVCEDIGFARDGCRAIVSHPLWLDGPRDDDSHLRLERIDTKESK